MSSGVLEGCTRAGLRQFCSFVCHPRESGGPEQATERLPWIPAFAGMTIRESCESERWTPCPAGSDVPSWSGWVRRSNSRNNLTQKVNAGREGRPAGAGRGDGGAFDLSTMSKTEVKETGFEDRNEERTCQEGRLHRGDGSARGIGRFGARDISATREMAEVFENQFPR
jgi:hypothetical protein